jgi:hypothetical protein
LSLGDEAFDGITYYLKGRMAVRVLFEEFLLDLSGQTRFALSAEQVQDEVSEERLSAAGPLSGRLLG